MCVSSRKIKSCSVKTQSLHTHVHSHRFCTHIRTLTLAHRQALTCSYIVSQDLEIHLNQSKTLSAAFKRKAAIKWGQETIDRKGGGRRAGCDGKMRCVDSNPCRMQETQRIFRSPSCHPSLSRWGSVTHSRCASIWCLGRLANSQLTWFLCFDRARSTVRALKCRSVALFEKRVCHRVLSECFALRSHICSFQPFHCSIHSPETKCLVELSLNPIWWIGKLDKCGKKKGGLRGNGGGSRRVRWGVVMKGGYWSESHDLETKGP